MDADPAVGRDQEGNEPPPYGLHGAGTLLDVLRPHPDCFGTVLQLMISSAQSARQQVRTSAWHAALECRWLWLTRAPAPCW